MRKAYINQFLVWIEEVLRAQLSIHLGASHQVVTPSLDICCAGSQSELKLLEKIDSHLEQHKRFMLLGNGGDGKTVTLLLWLRHRCYKAMEDDSKAIPVYVPLRSLTPNQNIYSLVRSSMGRFGMTSKKENLEEWLVSGHIHIVFDGLNEMHTRSEEGGAVQEIANFVETYPRTKFIISSRYTVLADSMPMQKVKMVGWDSQKIHHYLVERLGDTRGSQTFARLGANVDFEWMRRCSVSGLCSSPLTLWMIATVVEQDGILSNPSEDIANRLVHILVDRTPQALKGSIPSSVIVEVLEEFAYHMICEGYVVSINKHEALAICARITREWGTKGLLPNWVDSYRLLSLLVATGLIFKQ